LLINPAALSHVISILCRLLDKCRMSSAEDYRRKADALLSLAAETSDLNERSRLITEAVQWHMQATGEVDADGDAYSPTLDTFERSEHQSRD
jgi:hypothetical protein